MSTGHTSRGLSGLSQEECQDLFINVPMGVFTSTPDGRLLSANPAMARILGYDSPEELIKSVSDLAAKMYADPSDSEEIKRLLRENGQVADYERRALCRDGSTIWTCINARAVRDNEGHVVHYQGFVTDITRRKQGEEVMEQIQWMFQPGHASQEPVTPEYGNLLELNTSRVILDSVGEEMLMDIVKDFLDLLGTSVAVYEKNGDYALGIFSSRWCRFMDTASRRLCSTRDNREALDCGRWLCHESCWQAARTCIETEKPVDVECAGGIRLYAVPIFSNGKVIGTINMGYGDPPGDLPTLERLAYEYRVDVQELKECADAYEPRPHFIVQNARHRIKTAARMVGTIVERKQAQEALTHSYNLLRYIVEHTRSAVAVHDRDLNYIFVSQRYLDEFKVREKDVIGRHHYEVFPDLPRKWRDVHQRALQGEILSAEDDPYYRQDGTVEWTRWECRPWYEQDESIGGIIVYTEVITERKQNELRLQESEENLDRTLQSIGDGVISTDRQGRIVRMNPVAERLCGWQESQARGLFLNQVFRIVNAMTRETVQDPVDRVIKTGKVVGLANHTLLISKDGLEYQIADSAAPIQDNKGNITGAVLVFRDVTREYAQAERLRRSEERLDLAMAVKNEGIWDWNLITNETYFDDRYYTMAGYAPSEFPHNFEAWKERVHPEDLQQASAAIQAYLAGESDVYDTEFRFQHRDGSWIWIRGRGKIVERDAHGTPLRMVGTHSDITDRKQAEEALRESEEKYWQLFESSPISLWEQDFSEVKKRLDELKAQGVKDFESYLKQRPELVREMAGLVKVIDVNQGSLNLYKADSKDELLAGISRIFGKESYADFLQGLLLIASGETSFSFERDHVTLDGQDLKTQLYWSVIPGYEHDYSRVLVCIVDTTELMNIQDELRKAKEQAEASSHAKSEFLANMSHEIRTPINGIMGSMQVLQTTDLDGEQKQYVDLSIVSAQRLTRLLSDILDLSRIEAGQMEIREERLNLKELCDSVDELFMITSWNKEVDLECSLDPSLPPVLLGDQTRIQQILFNLVGNALKFTQKGSVNLQIFPQGHDENGSTRILISVSDTGPGIPDDQLHQMFKPFAQEENAYTRRHQGAGLGLSIVRRLAGLMGGNISVDSTPGEGCTFYVSLPLKLPPELKKDQGRQVSQKEADTRKMRIILAEDDPSNQCPTKVLLEKAGHEVYPAENGQEVLSLLADRDFDCILMDIHMPVMDGVEATRRIRAAEDRGQGTEGGDRTSEIGGRIPEFPNSPIPESSPELNTPEGTPVQPGKNPRIPIIAMTAYAMQGDREKFLEAGMDDYLAKPVHMADLEKVLRNNCG